MTQVEAPDTDHRFVVRNTDTPLLPLPVSSADEWEETADKIRLRIRTSCGLLFAAERGEISARSYGAVSCDGYTVSRVAIQTLPGLYLAANLYAPLTPGESMPCVLIAHGHWPEGRYAEKPEGSIAARALTFARQGWLALTYDMVGYGDTTAVSHRFAANARAMLHGVSLAGLQTWNSMRALDYLLSLPQADASRVAMTGESGGGTQTMLLTAVDPRITASAPCVMVSHSMQGGCLCENPPSLRLDSGNIDVARCAAPRPQIIVGATGDWTKTTETLEGPAVAEVYSLFGQEDKIEWRTVDAGHNINRESRNLVYAFLGRQLTGKAAGECSEQSYTPDAPEKLRVFTEGSPVPSDALDDLALQESMIERSTALIEDLFPDSPAALNRLREKLERPYSAVLAVEHPHPSAVWTRISETGSALGVSRLNLGRQNRGDSIAATAYDGNPGSHAAVLIPLLPSDPGSDGSQALSAELIPLIRKHARCVLVVALAAESRHEANYTPPSLPEGHFFTYNRSLAQIRLQDLVSAKSYLSSLPGVQRIVLAAPGRAGLTALLAAPYFDATAADICSADLDQDATLLDADIFVPGLREIGDYRTAAALAAPRPLLLWNTAAASGLERFARGAYLAAESSANLKIARETTLVSDLANWLTDENTDLHGVDG